jgi:hypothetical protein
MPQTAANAYGGPHLWFIFGHIFGQEENFEMAGKVRHAAIDSRARRLKLKAGRQPHWQALVPQRVALGYQRKLKERAGRWILRRYVDGKYTAMALGRADDAERADGENVLSYEQALAVAHAAADVPSGRVHRMTVRQAMEAYVEFKRARGQPVADLLSRSAVHILPLLGDLVVEDLTAERLRKWLATIAANPAQTRPKNGAPQYKAEPTTDEAIRARRATANRTLNTLRAALNHAFDEGLVSNRDAWSRK